MTRFEQDDGPLFLVVYSEAKLFESMTGILESAS